MGISYDGLKIYTSRIEIINYPYLGVSHWCWTMWIKNGYRRKAFGQPSGCGRNEELCDKKQRAAPLAFCDL